jgi:flagellar motor switch protein FliG
MPANAPILMQREPDKSNKLVTWVFLKFPPESVDNGGQLFPRVRLCAMNASNLRKAAVFLRSLSEKQVSLLLRKLNPDQALAVSAEMAGLQSISPEEQEEVVQDFAEANASAMETEPSNAAKPFQFLWDMGAKELGNLLSKEHPQTAALILSQLTAQQAAETLATLPPERQTSLLQRIAVMNPPSPEIVDDVEQCLQSLLTEPIHEESKGMTGVVKMLGAMRPTAERRLLQEIGQSDPNLLREIRRAMFGADVAAVC